MKRTIHITLLMLLCQAVMAQVEMTVTDCMRYAVEHNHDIRISQLTQNSRLADRTEAIGAFLPSITGSIGAQYNFGRAIDPETNTYTNVSTFYNGYSVSATLPLFDGFQRLNQLRASKAAIRMGRSQIRAQQDELTLQVFEAYCNVLYYQGTVRMAKEKQEQSRMTLRQSRMMCEVGQKSEADVAQMEAQLASDDYEVTRQESALKSAKLMLKQLMGWEREEDFNLVSRQDTDGIQARYQKYPGRIPNANSNHPALESAVHNVSVVRYQYHQSKGALLPSLSISGGVSTSYNKMLHAETSGFRDQLRNNLGEFIYASLTIPLFNRLATISSIRRQRNNLRIAEEQLTQKQDELTKLQLQAVNDCEGYQKQTVQMRRKVEADSLAYQLTVRKYEEGLSSSIDVQTTSATLLQSRAQLLQCQLMWALKQKLVNYYNGISLWTE